MLFQLNTYRVIFAYLDYPDDSANCFPDDLDRAEQLVRQEDLVLPFLSRRASWVIKLLLA